MKQESLQKCENKIVPSKGSEMDLEIRLNKISRKYESKEVYIKTFRRS